ncbi:hypothetical protein SRB5_01620 [Streptomyces sp. RB5]|uniref:Radical SAM core domain-containing protein n=1 Tax=Streptomyces smaragdinus TaxID=2585196 RepID=A0A7K0C9G2_9ACTN|nr:radical SAM protein [Streptomyces smaragdinus]MQY10058.1 hypothetical protein [Streptomyces smaragdinus]
MRIIKSERAWWALAGGTVARIPPEIAPLDVPALPDGIMRQLRDGMPQRPVKSAAYDVTVLTSTDCNLACRYCFQNEATPAEGQLPVRIARSTLTEETIGRVVEFVAGQMARYGKSALRLMLFGGEPLLAPQACLSLLERTAGLGRTQASMISNGVLLTGELAGKLEAAGLSAVQVTLDGDRESHDGIRHTRGNRPTYDTILDNVAAVRKLTGIRVFLRVNLSGAAEARLPALVADLAGRLEPDGVRVALALVRDPGIGFTDLVARERELAKRVVAGYVSLARHGFEVAIPGEPNCRTCGEVGGSGGAVVNADGTLYSCWESAGKPGWEVGDIGSGFTGAGELGSRWVRCGYSSGDDVDFTSVREFGNVLDGALLDALYREGTLHKASSAPELFG